MDLGGPQVQHAIEHVLEVCYVLALIVEPNCRTTGLNSYFSNVADRSTWEAHREEDVREHGSIAKSFGPVCWLRGQPTGNWVDEMPPWTQVRALPVFAA